MTSLEKIKEEPIKENLENLGDKLARVCSSKGQIAVALDKVKPIQNKGYTLKHEIKRQSIPKFLSDPTFEQPDLSEEDKEYFEGYGLYADQHENNQQMADTFVVEISRPRPILDKTVHKEVVKKLKPRAKSV